MEAVRIESVRCKRRKHKPNDCKGSICESRISAGALDQTPSSDSNVLSSDSTCELQLDDASKQLAISDCRVDEKTLENEGVSISESCIESVSASVVDSSVVLSVGSGSDDCADECSSNHEQGSVPSLGAVEQTDSSFLNCCIGGDVEAVWYAGDMEAAVLAPSAPPHSASYLSSMIGKEEESGSSVLTSQSDVGIQVSISEGPFCFEVDRKTSSVHLESSMSVLGDSCLERYYSHLSVQKVVQDVKPLVATPDFNSRFFVLVKSYLSSCRRLSDAHGQLWRLKDEENGYRAACWRMESRQITTDGFCADGRKVSLLFDYESAVQDESAVVDLRRVLDQRRHHLLSVMGPACHRRRLYRLQLHCYLTSLYQLAQKPADLAERLQHRASLRECISVLFHFQRSCSGEMLYNHKSDKSNHDSSLSDFFQETCSWLLQIRQWLVRINDDSCLDSVFIVAHVLRCPSGMSSWALDLLRNPPFTDSPSLLDYLLASLNLMMACVDGRKEMVNPGKPQVFSDEQEWVLVEDEEAELERADDYSRLQEQDLMLLLGALPWRPVFTVLLGSISEENASFCEFSIVRVFTYCHHLLRCLIAGLSVYGEPRHGQLCRLICRYLLDTLHLATDALLVVFTSLQAGSSKSRLQCEYDRMVYDALEQLLVVGHDSVWHCIAQLPFAQVSTGTAWKVLWLLHTENVTDGQPKSRDQKCWVDSILASDFQAQFQHRLVHMGASQVYFRLSAMSALASARPWTEQLLMQTASTSLLHVSFVTVATRQLCSKAGRDLLANICAVHPHIMSHILALVWRYLTDMGPAALYLVGALPLSQWRPDGATLELVCRWLTEHDTGSVASRLARLVFDQLDWGLDVYERATVLPAELHRSVALSVVSAQARYAPDAPLSFEQDIRQASSVEPALRRNVLSLRNISVEESSNNQFDFGRWCWKLLLRLRVHALDTGENASRLAIQQPVRGLAHVPPLGDSSLRLIFAPLRVQQQPLAMFGALMLSTLGHSVPEICGEGIAIALALVRSNYLSLEVELHLLQLLVPLFIYTPEELAGEVLSPLLSAILDSVDQPFYLSSVRNLVTRGGGFDMKSLSLQKQLAGIIQVQVSQHVRYGLETPEALVMVWLSCLTAVAHWQQRTSLVHVVDQLLRQAFAHASCRSLALRHMRDIVAAEESCGSEQVESGRLGSILVWVGRVVQPPQWSGVWPHTPWLSWFWLVSLSDVERKSGLWHDLVATLRETDCGLSLDEVLRRVCTQQRLPLRSHHALCVHRWAQLVLATPHECALLPELWRQLLALLLERVTDADGRQCGGVATRLIEDHLVSRLRARLLGTERYYRQLGAGALNTVHSISTAGSRAQVTTVADLLSGFGVWLDQLWRLDLPQLCVSMLPASCLPDRLAVLIESDDYQKASEVVWSDLLVPGLLHQLNDECSSGWQDHRCMNSSTKTKQCKKRVLSPHERLKKALHGFSAISQSEGQLNRLPSNVLTRNLPDLPSLLCTSDEVADDFIATSVQQLVSHAANISQTAAQLASLHNKCTDLLVGQLYENLPVRHVGRVTCTAASCSGAAVLTVRCLAAKRGTATHVQLESNDIDAKTCEDSICTSSIEFSQAAAQLQRFIDKLADSADSPVVTRIGAALFFRVGGMADVGADHCVHVSGLLETWLQQLGRRFVVGRPDQCAPLLEAVCKQVRLQQYLLPHFDPLVLADDQYVQLWYQLPQLCVANFQTAGAVLSQFQLFEWLREHCTTASHRSTVIGTLVHCLRETGFECSEYAQHLREVLIQHVVYILQFDMIEHLEEVLCYMLDLAGEGRPCQSVWQMLTFCLVGNDAVLDSSVQQSDLLGLPLATILSHCRQSLTPFQLQHCCRVLGKRFLGERLEADCIGLFSRYSGHCRYLCLFLSVLSGKTVLSIYELDPNVEIETLIQLLWTEVEQLWGPWLSPRCSDGITAKTHCSSSEKSQNGISPPWTSDDVEAARLILAGLSSVLGILLTESSASSALLGRVWKYYLREFAGSGMPDHVLRPTHSALLELPWSLFVISVDEVESIATVLYAYLPEPHVFVSQLVVQLPWCLVVQQHLSQSFSCAQLHSLLLTILMRVASEPRVRQSGELFLLLSRAESFAWHTLDETGYQRALSWYISTCEPRAVLETDDGEPVDLVLVGLLQVAAELPSTSRHADSDNSHATAKASLFVRSIVRLMCVAGFKYKTLISRNPGVFTRTLHRLLALVPSQVGRLALCSDKEQQFVGVVVPPDDDLVSLLLTAILGCCSDIAPEQLVAVCVSGLLDWLDGQKNDSRILRVALKVSCNTFCSASHLAEVLDSVLLWLFSSESDDFTWHEAVTLVHIPERLYEQFTKSCVSGARLLVLHLLFLQELMEKGLNTLQIRKEGILNSESISLITALMNSTSVKDVRMTSNGTDNILLSGSGDTETANAEESDPQRMEKEHILLMAERGIDWLCGLPQLSESTEMYVCPLLHQILCVLVAASATDHLRVAQLSRSLAVLLTTWSDERPAGSGLLSVLGLLGRRSSLSQFFRVLCRIVSVTLMTNISSELQINLEWRCSTDVRWPAAIQLGCPPSAVTASELSDGLLPEAYSAFDHLLAARGSLSNDECIQLVEGTIADILSSTMNFYSCLSIFSDGVKHKFRHKCLHMIY